ncbi:MAG: hypothetical protein ACREMN_04750 [Gemmatimonadales bacterium]
MIAVLVLFATVLLRFTLVVAVVYLLLPRGRACPRCGDRLVPIHHGMLTRVLPMLVHGWCLACGWSGLVRRAPAAPRAGGGWTQRPVIKRAARS